jgi:REP element-mobilizing transposase RayT
MCKEKISPNNLKITRRKLPHWQIGGSWYFITFKTKKMFLGPLMRDIVRDAIMHEHEKKFSLAAGVVMPDHAHLLCRPSQIEETYNSLTEILRSLKGVSGMRINKLSGRAGAVWQKESYDRIVRDEKEWLEKYDYIRNNAVKAELTASPEEYNWLIEIPNSHY